MAHLLCYLLGMGNHLKSFKLPLMELQVKELQKADIKACCIHELMEGRYSIVYGTTEVARNNDKLIKASIH